MPAPPPGQDLLDRILDAARVGENDDWEFKSAKGGLPGSLWETYSAFANSGGGTIVLGASEKGDTISLDGRPEVDLAKLRIDLESQLNSPQKVNRNILASRDIKEVPVDGGWLLVIPVRPAARGQRPIYVGLDPMKGTYKRGHQGDFKCTEDEVRRMFADADNEPADSRIVRNFDLRDIDRDSLDAYRNLLKASRPAGHPWVALGDVELLEQLGGWRTNRDSGEGNVTVAGLLMFGKFQSIVDPVALPKFSVDYRDYRGRRPEERWGDRVFPDGTWEANLFQFYRRIWPKLTADLKVPFTLKGVQRVDETQAHEALREAIVNAMIHSDYKVGGGIVIEQYDDRYDIENPGTLLVSLEQLRRGHFSECRNPALQTMFRLIGLGEQAGSGYARIQSGWKSQQWRAPLLTVQSNPDRVRLEMRMESLIPDEAFAELHQKLGAAFDRLETNERLAMVTALLESEVSNTRMQDLVTDHAADITKLLRGLVTKGFLVSDNQRRWSRYRLPNAFRDQVDLFSPGKQAEASGVDSTHLPKDSTQLGQDSTHIEADSLHNGPDSSHIAADSILSEDELQALRLIAEPVAKNKRANPDKLRDVILKLCKGRFLTAEQIATLCHREVSGLRSRSLSKLVKEGVLRLRHPNTPNRPDQAYIAAEAP